MMRGQGIQARADTRGGIIAEGYEPWHGRESSHRTVRQNASFHIWGLATWWCHLSVRHQLRRGVVGTDASRIEQTLSKSRSKLTTEMKKAVAGVALNHHMSPSTPNTKCITMYMAAGLQITLHSAREGV